MSGSMRQLEERQLPAEVTKMQWSPKMDLLALANTKGEVVLHRLTWQRVWLLAPQEESDTTVNIAWRPDGKLLAVYYEPSNLLTLIDIENKSIVHKTKLTLQKTITSMTWLSLNNAHTTNLLNCKMNTLPTGEYLPPLPSLNRSFSQVPEKKEFLSYALNILFLGQQDGNIVMFAFGMFYCGTIFGGHGPIIEISGDSCGSIWIMWQDKKDVKVNRLSCQLFQHGNAFFKVAQVQANVEYLMDYLSRTLMAISEAWETILLEMDEKLARYAETNTPGAVAADFLELLMIGNATQNLENFLLRDLTEKGLKKLGHSIEMCYSNIQKLVLKNLTSVGMALVYQIAEMKGMVRLGGQYELLGLSNENSIHDALLASEAFLAKSLEIQQMIDHSMRDYKAFFRWLYVAISRLTDERISSEVSRFSQQELTFIAEFLRGFDKTEAGSKKGVNLEKLGQYLRRETLQTCLTPQGSEWALLLRENQCLRDHGFIINQDLTFSLLQSHSKLIIAIQNVFNDAYQGLVDHFNILSTSLPNSVSDVTSQVVTNDGSLLVAATDSDRKFLKLYRIDYLSGESATLSCKFTVICVDTRQGNICVKTGASTYEPIIVDLQFYSKEYLSVLLVNKQTQASFLVQLPINNRSIFETRNTDVIKLADVLGYAWPRPFYGMSVGRLAVSGMRKVVAVLSENSRKIRLFETEVEPDDEEDDDEEDEEDEHGALSNSMMSNMSHQETSNCHN